MPSKTSRSPWLTTSVVLRFYGLARLRCSSIYIDVNDTGGKGGIGFNCGALGFVLATRRVPLVPVRPSRVVVSRKPLTESVFEKGHVGTIRLSMRRMAAMSI